MLTLQTFHDRLREYADVKRFYERWAVDPSFRDAIAADASAALERCNVRLPRDVVASMRGGATDALNPARRAMGEITQSKARWVDDFYHRVAVPSSPRVAAWRRRQIARQMLDLGPLFTLPNIHASLCVELTAGCSVGCWFCALSPGRLSRAFAHDAATWRDVLGACKTVLGDGAKSGFLYWATDPLDNPEYEKFCLDFHREVGVFPPTTTALALKDPARTHALIALSQQHDCWLNRFSILTVKTLDRVHAEFSAEELASVECLPLNKESAFAFGNAGRFRERAQRDDGLLDRQKEKLMQADFYARRAEYRESDDYALGSIGCVTGFLLNVADRSVELISPCTADDDHPRGYYVFERGSFTDAAALEAVMAGMIERHMYASFPRDGRVALPAWLDCRDQPDGIAFVGRFGQAVALQDPDAVDMLHRFAALVRERPRTADDLCAALPQPPTVTREWIDQLMEAGVLAHPPTDHHERTSQ